MEMQRRKWILVRTWTAILVAFAFAGAAILAGPATRQVRAQEAIAAAIVEGDCGNPGDVAAELRDLTVAEGGALTSFTTIDLSIGDLTSGDYAVVAGDPDDPDACGEISGEGDDVYVTVSAQGDASLGGVAWLHARNDRTQVSLFLGEGLGGGGGGGNNVEPPAEETPEPPAEETPEPEPTRPAGDTETYTSPTFGYTIDYDTEVWEVAAEQSQPGEGGTTDIFVLSAPNDPVQAEFYGVPADPRVTALDIVANVERNILSDPSLIDPAVRVDDDGDPIRGGDEEHAYVAIDFAFESDSGRQYNNVYHVEIWTVPSAEGALMMIFQTPQSSYDDWADAREALTGGVNIPD